MKTETSSPVTPTPPARRRIVGLDGPRGVACICVLITHMGHFSPHALGFWGGLLGQGMIFFFALSGFLLYLPFVNALRRSKPFPDVKSYFRHRFLRVFPGYLAIFLLANFVLQAVYVTNAWSAVQPPYEGTDHGTGMMTDPLALLANLTLVHSFFPSLLQTGINPSWSLSMEFLFYFALPALAAGVFWLHRRYGRGTGLWWATIPAAVLFIVGMAGKTVQILAAHHEGISDMVEASWGPNWAAVVSRSFFGFADNFAFGMLAAVIYVGIANGDIRGFVAERLRWICAAAMIPLGIASVYLLAQVSPFLTTPIAAAAGGIILFIIAPLALGKRSVLAEVLDYRPMEYLGRISLSIYLWHFPVLIVVGRLGWNAGDTALGLLWNSVLVSALSVALGSLTYWFVEKPAIDFAKAKKPPAASPAQ